MSRRLESISLAVLASLAIGISVLDLSGLLDGMSWIRQRVPVITLLAIGILITHLAVSSWNQRGQFDDIAENIARQVRASVDVVCIQEFNDALSYFRYINDRLETAQKSVDDITWGKVVTAQVSTETKRTYEAYRKTIQRICSARRDSPEVIYREIMSFPDGARLRRARDLMNRRYPNYHLRFFDYAHDASPPLFQFFVIDRREVLISINATSAFDNRYYSIESEKVASLFSAYFEIAWREADVLKDVHNVRLSVLDDIEARFSA